MTEQQHSGTMPEQEAARTETPPDLPEEGFVPFNQEFGLQKQKKKRVLLCLLLCFAVLLGVFLLLSNTCSYYNQIMRSLQFDYRSGEIIGEPLSDSTGEYGSALAAEAAGKNIELTANVYVFNSDSDLSTVAYRYDYTHNSSGDSELTLKIGTDHSFFSNSLQFASDPGNQVWELSGKNKEPSGNPEASLLYDYLFTAGESDRYSASCYDSYFTSVGNEQYVCEIWLITVPINGEEVFVTLYRYYQKSRLCAVRCLTSSSDLMFVYDITGYTIQ